MADNPAHTTPGPESDPLDTPFPIAEPTLGRDIPAVAAPAAGIAASPTAASAPDVELVGRHTVAQAQLGERTASTVLVGAATATSANGDGAGMTAPGDGEPEAEPKAASVDDLPVWSFREPPTTSEVDPPTASEVDPPPLAPVDGNQVELPFSLPPEPEAVAERSTRPQPLFGPIGRTRSALAVALLAVVTLGISALVWHHRANRELEEFDPKLHSRPGRSTAAVAVAWLLGLLVTLVGAVFIVGGRLSIQVPFASHVTTLQADAMLAGLLAVPYLTLLVPFSLVAVVMTLERLRCVEEHVGTTTDRQVRPVGTAMLLVVPVIGGLVLLGIAQRRINAVWDAVAPAGHLVR